MTTSQTDTPPKPERAWAATARTLVQTLWFPAFFMTGFLCCYLLAFHNPQPHDVKVAVPAPAASQLQHALDKQAPGAYKIDGVQGGAGDVRAAVENRDASAGYVPDATHPRMYVAGAEGQALQSVVQKPFTAMAKQSGTTLQTTDVAPRANGDGMGTGLFYLCLVWTIPSYIMVMMLLRAPGFGRRKKVTTLVVSGAVLSVITYYVGLLMDVVPNNPLALVFAFLLTQGVALTSYGLVPFAKQFFPGVAMGLFVLLSMPSSGGAVPIQMVPGFFRALHPFMPLGNLVEALRGIFYYDGAGIARPILVLCLWVLLGVFLIGLGAWLERRRARREAQPDAEAVLEAEEAVRAETESTVEDPSFEMPLPSSVSHAHRIGAQEAMLSGRVTDEVGTPLPGVTVTVTSAHGQQLVKVVTEPDGEYAVSGLPEEFVNVIVVGPDRASAVDRVLVRSGHPVRQDFVLPAHQVAAR